MSPRKHHALPDEMLDALVECWLKTPDTDEAGLAECSGVPLAAVRQLVRSSRFLVRAYDAKRRTIALKYLGPILDRAADLAVTGSKRESVQAMGLLDKALALQKLVRQAHLEESVGPSQSMEDVLDEMDRE